MNLPSTDAAAATAGMLTLQPAGPLANLTASEFVQIREIISAEPAFTLPPVLRM